VGGMEDLGVKNGEHRLLLGFRYNSLSYAPKGGRLSALTSTYDQLGSCF
jgi:hypothetical protein